MAVYKELNHHRLSTRPSINREYIIRNKVYIFLLGLKTAKDQAITTVVYGKILLYVPSKQSQNQDLISGFVFIT